MCRTLVCCIVLIGLSVPLLAQTAAPDVNTPASTLRINSRAVLVDVIVTDRSGKPVTGLKQDAFAVTEQGKPQTIGFFEEHTAAPEAAPQEMPKLPPNVFSNFSPNPQPPAVNVLLLDSLNTNMENESFVHSQAMKFLKSAKPGSPMAIFTMGQQLRFIQGFTADPVLLMAALNNKKNNEVEQSALLKGQGEADAQKNLLAQMRAGGASAAAIAILKRFFEEQENSQNLDRGLLTLGNLQRLATFLSAFPGRKNVIWFTESLPALFMIASNSRDLAWIASNPGIDSEYKKTMNMLTAARVALYPVDARGVATVGFFQADKSNNQPAAPGQPAQWDQSSSSDDTPSAQMRNEDIQRNSDQSKQENFAQDSGGRAFANTNSLSEVIDKIRSTTSDFYTLSYTPTDPKVDGGFRKIEVKIDHGGYALSFRRGYFATKTDGPSSAAAERSQQIQNLSAQNPESVNPLLLFMDFGMPQAQQILFEARIQPASRSDQSQAPDSNPAKEKGSRYTVAFAIDLKDLRLKLDSDGNHKGKLNISLIAYDRYGNIAGRNDQTITLNAKPDAYAVYQNYGVQVNADIEVPKGQFWLRAGVYDHASQRVGTMEIPLSSVVPLQTAVPLLAAVPLQTPVSSQASTKDAAILPARAAEKVTVEQLEHTLAAAHGKKDQDVGKRLSEMELSERLTSEKLATMEAELPGGKSRMALVALADASAFLQLPATEIPATAAPDAGTQRLILSKAAENVIASIQRFPDFFARQTTNRFHDLKVSYPTSEPTIRENQAFQLLDSFSDTVSYRNGQEVEETTEKHRQDRPMPRDGLVNWGLFGPLQRIVMTDIYKGKIGWGHWEQRATGPVAVFRYSIPKEKSDYVVKYCCVGLPTTGFHSFESMPPIHGEIAIDPATGAVYRLVLITDLSPSDPIFRAEIMVEYQPVEIGGKTYVSPSKSVTITTAIAPIFRQGCEGGVGVMTTDCTRTEVFQPKDTAINDTVYDSYHVFRSEMRILPEGNAGQGDRTPPSSSAPAPPPEP
jgi:VWFA-related protein